MLSQYRKQLADKGELYLNCKVRPNSAKTEIKTFLDNDAIKINVAAVAKKDKANQELIKFLANEFEVNKSNVTIISGARDRNKLVKIVN